MRLSVREPRTRIAFKVQKKQNSTRLAATCTTGGAEKGAALGDSFGGTGQSCQVPLNLWPRTLAAAALIGTRPRALSPGEDCRRGFNQRWRLATGIVTLAKADCRE